MKIDKTFQVNAAQKEVWELITSPEQVATCLPGVEEVSQEASGKYKGTMNIKVGPIKTSVKADVDEIEQRAPEFASYTIKGEEGGRASRLNANAALTLAPVTGEQTTVSFVADVVIVGRLGKFAGGVMNKLADSMSEQFIVAFRTHLEGEPPAVEAKASLWTRFTAWLRSLFRS